MYDHLVCRDPASQTLHSATFGDVGQFWATQANFGTQIVGRVQALNVSATESLIGDVAINMGRQARGVASEWVGKKVVQGRRIGAVCGLVVRFDWVMIGRLLDAWVSWPPSAIHVGAHDRKREGFPGPNFTHRVDAAIA